MICLDKLDGVLVRESHGTYGHYGCGSPQGRWSGYREQGQYGTAWYYAVGWLEVDDVSRDVLAACVARHQFYACIISQQRIALATIIPRGFTRLLSLRVRSNWRSSSTITVIHGTMSDYEDGMDVDPKPPTDAIQFSSDKSTGKTKRLTADLPVEAADNLPW